MALNLSQKKEVVAELADVAAKAHSLIAAEYAGTSVSQMTAMRKKARENGAAGRLIKEFAKTNDKLQPKVVAVGGQLYPASHVEVLASLPTLEQALAMLARVLAEPATMFARAVKAVGEQQGGGEAAPAEEAAAEA